MKLVLFSGTTEGRKLSELLAAAGIRHTVCVATEYGSELMEKGGPAEICVGRMDAAQITAFLGDRGFGAEDLVIDATHPYAVEATANIRKAAENSGTGYLRVLRGEDAADTGTVRWYDTMEECAAALEEEAGRVLLTTGSKELSAYCHTVSDATRERTCVRILPAQESLMICQASGIAAKNILAMQGPFSAEMNRAILRQYDIRHLVTKDSGAAGGFEEKLLAAKETGVICHVIRRPEKEEGVDLYEAYERVTGRKAQDIPGRQIILAGYGPGSHHLTTQEVRRSIEEADAVFGADRLIADLSAHKKYAMYRAGDIIPQLQADPQIRRAVILFTGDSGFYSGARAMYRELRAWDESADIRILPGISSVSLLAARLGESYDDAAIVSIHGRKTPGAMHQLLQKIRFHEKTFVLLSGDEDVRDIGERLCSCGMDARITVGSDLSYESEMIRTLSPAEASSFRGTGVLTVLILHDPCEKRPILPVLSDDDLLRDRVPMTKACIRHESILRLGLREGDVVYDIGGGTGSVALEIAAMDPSLTVYTFEKSEAACGLIRENIAKLHAENVTLLQGEAPEVFADIEAPDCVFIGGSGGRLFEILSALSAGKQKIRCVLNAVTLETMEEASRITREIGAADVEMIQLQCTPVREAGRYHMMQAQNPVMIVSFTLN